MNNPKDSTVVAHARRELELVGALGQVDMDVSEIGRGTLALVKLYDRWCKGDQNKMKAISDAFALLVQGALLSPPTTDKSEWEPVDVKDPRKGLRSTRSPFYISHDGGKNWIHFPSHTKGVSITKEETSEPTSQNTGDAGDVRPVERVAVDGSKDTAGEVKSLESGTLDSGMESKKSEDTRGPEVKEAKSKDRKKK